MKKSLIIIIALLWQYTFAQTKPTSTNGLITISGDLINAFASNADTSNLYISYYDDCIQEYPKAEKIYPIKAIGNKFSLTIKPEGDIGYFRLKPVFWLRSVSNFMFLVEKGDDIHITFKNKNEAVFTGKGSEKLTFQQWAGWTTVPLPKLSPGQKWEKISSRKYRTNLVLRKVLDSLNKCSNSWSPQAREVIRLNSSSSLMGEYIKSISLNISVRDSSYRGELIKELENLYTQQMAFSESSPTLIKNAFMYIKFLYALNSHYANSKMPESTQDSYPVFYGNIRNNYTGILRDKLLPYCFMNKLKDNQVATDYLEDALQIVRDSVSKTIISSIAEAKSKGVKAFDFTVEGLDGKTLKLGDFKDKILVVDTWFNGCINCRIVVQELEPIIEHFKNRKDVVFMSLNATDKNRKRFEDGAKGGLYGSKKSVFAWTAGLGDQHPMIRHYQYKNYPNLLIIGKDGNVISANPKRAYNEQYRQKFIELIEENL